MKTSAYGAYSATSPLEYLEINRRDVGPDDVGIDILYCGICHSDIHFIRNEWGTGVYPGVPGHEIIGRIHTVGQNVRNFKQGELVGVGCMVDSCGTCEPCHHHEEMYCDKGVIWTYGSPDTHLSGHTHGGYSKAVVVDQKFVLHVSENLDTRAVAPLLCAGITTWSPLRRFNVSKGDRVGVIGLGGLGHMGVKLAHALGAHVTMITTSPKKGDDARKLGADSVLISTDSDAMAKAANTFDFLLNTIPVGHDVNPYLKLLRHSRTMALVGAVEPLGSVNGALLVHGGRNLVGSLIGGIRETQEMLDFCAEHNVIPDVEMINIKDVNTAYERVIKSDVKYRFVIDMSTLDKPA